MKKRWTAHNSVIAVSVNTQNDKLLLEQTARHYGQMPCSQRRSLRAGWDRLTAWRKFHVRHSSKGRRVADEKLEWCRLSTKIMDYHDVTFPGGMPDDISRWVRNVINPADRVVLTLRRLNMMATNGEIWQTTVEYCGTWNTCSIIHLFPSLSISLSRTFQWMKLC